MKVQSDCDPHSVPANAIRHVHPGIKLHENKQEERNPRQTTQLNALKSEFDNMEESLRDALRHNSRPMMTKDDTNKHMPVCENTFTKRHNYITVYEHDQSPPSGNFRSAPQYVAENIRPHPVNHPSSVNVPMFSSSPEINQIGNVNIDEFRNYCSLLTGRIQKMEDQNMQLLQLAEQQKVEYDKVAAQVVHSEHSYRQLLTECFNLRRQVQQLANHNMRLREQQSSHLNSPSSSVSIKGSLPSSPGSTEEEADHTGQIFPESSDSSFESTRHLHGGTERERQNGRILGKYNPTDLAAIIELYTALQKATLTDLKNSGIANAPAVNNDSPRKTNSNNEQAPMPPLDVIHEQPEHHVQTRTQDHADYASPSSICATKSCETCASRFSEKKPPMSKPRDCVQHCEPRCEQESEKQAANQRLLKTKARAVERSQSFDNNAYVEVELKPGPQFESSPQKTDSSHSASSVKFRRDNRLRRSHNHYNNVTTKIAEPQRPSSLVLDLESAQNVQQSPTFSQYQPVIPASVALSPVSPYENSDVFLRPNAIINRNGNNNNKPEAAKQNENKPANLENSYEIQRQSSRSADNESLKVWLPRKSPSTSFLNDPRHAPLVSATPPLSSKKTHFKSSSVSDLPPPPPPPPEEEEEAEADVIGTRPAEFPSRSVAVEGKRTRSSSADATPSSSENHCRTKFDRKEELRPKVNEGFPRKLSVWRQHDDAHHRHQTAKSQCEQNAAGWRRGSYAAACRKSQSLDHLYEQVLMENEKARSRAENAVTVDKEESGATTFSTLQPNRRSNRPTNLPYQLRENLIQENEASTSPLSPKLSDKPPSEDDFPPPPPHLLQKSQDPSSPYEVMMPLKFINAKREELNPHPEKSPTHLQKTSQQQIRSPSTKSRLQKYSGSEPSVYLKRTPTRELSRELHVPKSPDLEVDIGRVTSLPDDVLSADQVFEPTSSRVRSRRMSEGSSGQRRKDKYDNETGKCQLRRHGSVGSDFAINKRREGAIPRYQEHVAMRLNSDKTIEPRSPTSNIPQNPRQPTNPNLRLQGPRQLAKREYNNASYEMASKLQPQGQSLANLTQGSVERRKASPVHEKKTQESPPPKITALPDASKTKGSEKPQIRLSIPSTGEKSPDSNESTRGRSVTKANKKSKETSSSNGGGKKKGLSASAGSKSKSFANIMKAKFARSTSAGRSSSAGKKGNASENIRAPDSFSISPIKPATASIDPRTLSLEPNSYLPPGKDGSSISKKGGKQKLGRQSDAAVGRKLSQPFPNGIALDSRSQSQLNKVVEEVLSDEGFAEGSTIERAEKEAAACRDQKDNLPMSEESPRYVDVVMTKSIATRDKHQNGSSNDIRRSENRNIAKKENADWYDSVVSLDKRGNDEKRFQVVQSDSAYMSSLINQAPIKQKHTRNTATNEPTYENFVLENKNTVYENTEILNTASSNRPTGRDVFATGVTIVRASPQNSSQPSSSVPQHSKKSPLKLPKSSQGGAFGRIMKSVGTHYSGSKEDLSSRGSVSLTSSGSVTNINQGKETKKIYAEHQKVFEKAFISSVVQAELSQRLSERNSIAEPSTPDKLNEAAQRRFPIPSTSSVGDSLATESVGTGSSFGSLPSDGISSNHSGDVIDCQGITSSGSSESPVKQQQPHRMSKNKRNSLTSFGLGPHVGKTGTGGSHTSTSSSEISFKGRSRLPGSAGPRSPAASSPPSTKDLPQSRLAHSSGSRLEKRATSAEPTSKPPAYKEPQPQAHVDANPMKNIPTRRSQSGSRISRMAAPRKLPSPGKVAENRNNMKKSPESSSPKVKLAPLNYGFTPPSGAGGRSRSRGNTPQGSVSEPIYENASVIQQQGNVSNGIQAPQPARQIQLTTQTQRQGNSSFGNPVSRPPNGCGPSQLDIRRSKRSIPSPGGLHRPRPVYPGVGAG